MRWQFIVSFADRSGLTCRARFMHIQSAEAAAEAYRAAGFFAVKIVKQRVPLNNNNRFTQPTQEGPSCSKLLPTLRHTVQLKQT